MLAGELQLGCDVVSDPMQLFTAVCWRKTHITCNTWNPIFNPDRRFIRAAAENSYLSCIELWFGAAQILALCSLVPNIISNICFQLSLDEKSVDSLAVYMAGVELIAHGPRYDIYGEWYSRLTHSIIITVKSRRKLLVDSLQQCLNLTIVRTFKGMQVPQRQVDIQLFDDLL